MIHGNEEHSNYSSVVLIQETAIVQRKKNPQVGINIFGFEALMVCSVLCGIEHKLQLLPNSTNSIVFG